MDRRRQMLLIARGELRPSALQQATELVDQLRTHLHLPDGHDPDVIAAIRSFFSDIVDHELSEDLRDAARIMLGLDRDQAIPQLREVTLEQMARHLPRQRDRFDAGHYLGTKRVSQLEVTKIAPALVEALDKRLGVGGRQQRSALATRVTDLTVRFTFSQCEDDQDLLWCRSTDEFNSNRPHLDFVVTREPTDAPALLASDDSLFDTLTPARDIPLRDVDVSVRRILSPDRRQDLPKEWLSHESVSAARHRAGLELNAEVEILRFAAPGEDLDSAMDARFRIRTAFQIRISEHYVSWSAPKDLELQSIAFDLSGFPRYREFQFELQPFLDGSEEIDRSRHDEIVVNADRWIQRGAGVALSWSQKR